MKTPDTPVTIYIVHHPDCKDGESLAKALYDWFRLGYLSGDSSAAGLPVYFRRQLDGAELYPDIDFDEASANVVIVLVDHKMVIDNDWRAAIVKLSETVHDIRMDSNSDTNAILLPAAMHDSFYRTGPLYNHFNPIRLLQMTTEEQVATIRRATTEATARMLRADKGGVSKPLDVFLSHAKQDGIPIAECIRDSVRKFGQLNAWYDANDLPIGGDWESPMTKAAGNDTAAMVAAVTDAYPTRPWCRREAKLARTPKRMTTPKGSRVWKIQPVVAVHQPGSGWVRGVPMLEGVPRIGWNEEQKHEQVERIVDRLVLEVLLGQAHRQVATKLDQQESSGIRNQSCFITWIPDSWTLAALRHEMGRRRASAIRRIVYPGYGLTIAEAVELEPVVASFHDDTKLVSFEEAWNEQ